MKNFDVKTHTNRYMKLAKAAGNGDYPNRKIAKIGSKIGIGVGGALCCVGIYGLTQIAVFGIGSLSAGILTISSNIINLKRLKQNQKAGTLLE